MHPRTLNSLFCELIVPIFSYYGPCAFTRIKDNQYESMFVRTQGDNLSFEDHITVRALYFKCCYEAVFSKVLSNFAHNKAQIPETVEEPAAVSHAILVSIIKTRQILGVHLNT